MTTTLIPVITKQGLAATINAQNNGLQAAITEVGFGNVGWTPTEQDSALRGEQHRIAIDGGVRISDTQIHITAVEQSDTTYWVREIGFYFDDGTLFAILSNESEAYAYKTAGIDLLIGLDLLIRNANIISNITMNGSGNFNLPIATEINRGIIRLATAEEALAAEDSTTAITPSQLRAYLNDCIIKSPTTITVGPNETYTDIQQAWDSLSNKVLQADVTIQVTDGTYAHNAIYLRHHPDAHHIHIEGNKKSPNNCILDFSLSDTNQRSYGIIADNVRGLTLTGFTLSGATGSITDSALLLQNHAHMTISDIIIRNCEIGIHAQYNAIISGSGVMNLFNCARGVVVEKHAEAYLPGINIAGRSQTVGAGIEAREMARVRAPNSQCLNCHTAYSATINAYLWCDSAKVTTCTIGISAIMNATVYNQAGKIDNCNEIGLLAEHNGIIIANQADVTNCQYGFISRNLGYIEARFTSASGCLYGYSVQNLSILNANGTSAFNNEVDYDTRFVMSSTEPNSLLFNDSGSV